MILLSLFACSYDIFLGDSKESAQLGASDSSGTPADDSDTACTIPVMATVDTALVTVDWTALEPIDAASLMVYGSGDAASVRAAACADALVQGELIDSVFYTGSESFASMNLETHAGSTFIVNLRPDLTWVADIQPGGTTEVVLP